MATFSTGGIAAEMERFRKLALSSEDACKAAVKAGGKVLAKRLSEAAPRDTGELSRSIKAGTVEYSVADGYHCEVAPVGNHSKTGEPLAKIGNILEYGRSNMPARPWFNPTVAASEGEVRDAMRTAADKRTGGT